MSQAKPHPLSAKYDALAAAGTVRADTTQRAVAARLDALLEQLSGIVPSQGSFFQKLFSPKATPINGIYLWGDVGRGKSMLMDLFVEEAKKISLTRRVHFHAFMLDVHRRLFSYRQHQETDPLAKVIAEIADETRVLCLDEFQVTDVADAMILARLFTGLMDAGMIVLFTSNRPPRELYQGGLQRDQFLKFVTVLEARLTMLALNGPEDYRLAQHRTLVKRYAHPCNGDADDFLLESWRKLTGDAASEPQKLSNDGRMIHVDKQAHGVAWFTFGELCARPLGASDYLMIARLFHTVLLQGIPRMTPEERNEAKRFVTLIDALYDHRVKLLATAAAPPEAIYAQGDGTFEFHRTVSRLHEMQSDEYLQLPHIG